MKLYCLSGLGVDHRAFREIKIKGVELVHIPWIEPLKNEYLADYAERLFDTTAIPEEYNLMGVSFGGMIAQEFEKIRKPKDLFLVSTISDSSELPSLFRIGGRLKLYKLIPKVLLKKSNWFTNYLFGVKQKQDKILLKEILGDTDISFLRWAMGAIVQWKNNSISAGIRLHGGRDKILPKKENTDFFIPEAGHFMIATHGEKLSEQVCTVLTGSHL